MVPPRLGFLFRIEACSALLLPYFSALLSKPPLPPRRTWKSGESGSTQVTEGRFD